MDTNVLVFDTFEDREFHAEAASGLDSIDERRIPGMASRQGRRRRRKPSTGLGSLRSLTP